MGLWDYRYSRTGRGDEWVYGITGILGLAGGMSGFMVSQVF